jgi:hypothetical protein
MFWLIPAREEIFDNLILIGFEAAIRPLEALLSGDGNSFCSHNLFTQTKHIVA